MKFIYFLMMLSIFNIAIMNPAHSSELLVEGTVLSEDSMVFSIQEARDLAQYVSSLEAKISNNEELLEQKDLLIENKDLQIQSFEEWMDLRDQEIDKYIEIQELDESRISDLERQAKGKKLEVIGAFAGGIILSTVLIIVADQLDDKVLEASPNINSERTSRSLIRF